MNNENRFVAIALLDSDDVARLGSSLKKVYRIDPTPRFDELIRALDEADDGGLCPLHVRSKRRADIADDLR